MSTDPIAATGASPSQTPQSSHAAGGTLAALANASVRKSESSRNSKDTTTASERKAPTSASPPSDVLDVGSINGPTAPSSLGNDLQGVNQNSANFRRESRDEAPDLTEDAKHLDITG